MSPRPLPAPMARLSATAPPGAPARPGNRRRSLGLRAQAALASGLLSRRAVGGLARTVVLAMATAMASGCLVTGDLEPREPEPTPVNHPPRFMESSIQPSNWTCRKPDGDLVCDRLSFKVGVVIDEDLDDQLVARWVVDYDPTPGAPKTLHKAGQIRTSPNDLGEWPGGPNLEFSFDPESFAPGIHTVKVLVSDGFVPSSSELDKVAEGKGLASYSWCVDTSACSGARR